MDFERPSAGDETTTYGMPPPPECGTETGDDCLNASIRAGKECFTVVSDSIFIHDPASLARVVSSLDGLTIPEEAYPDVKLLRTIHQGVSDTSIRPVINAMQCHIRVGDRSEAESLLQNMQQAKANPQQPILERQDRVQIHARKIINNRKSERKRRSAQKKHSKDELPEPEDHIIHITDPHELWETFYLFLENRGWHSDVDMFEKEIKPIIKSIAESTELQDIAASLRELGACMNRKKMHAGIGTVLVTHICIIKHISMNNREVLYRSVPEQDKSARGIENKLAHARTLKEQMELAQ